MVSQRWKQRVVPGAALLLGIFGLTACATKRYVGEEVSKSSAASEKRINEVESQVEAAQGKVREHARGSRARAGRRKARGRQVRLLARPLR